MSGKNCPERMVTAVFPHNFGSMSNSGDKKNVLAFSVVDDHGKVLVGFFVSKFFVFPIHLKHTKRSTIHKKFLVNIVEKSFVIQLKGFFTVNIFFPKYPIPRLCLMPTKTSLL